MSRYKPVGWRHESHRHYLASKGITSKYNYLVKKPLPSKDEFADMIDAEHKAKQGYYLPRSEIERIASSRRLSALSDREHGRGDYFSKVIPNLDWLSVRKRIVAKREQDKSLGNVIELAEISSAIPFKKKQVSDGLSNSARSENARKFVYEDSLVPEKKVVPDFISGSKRIEVKQTKFKPKKKKLRAERKVEEADETAWQTPEMKRYAEEWELSTGVRKPKKVVDDEFSEVDSY